MRKEMIYMKKVLNITKTKEIRGMKKLFGFVVIMFFMSWGQAFADYSFNPSPAMMDQLMPPERSLQHLIVDPGL